MSISGYSEPTGELPSLLTAVEISALFKKTPRWFSDHRVRHRLYRQGFPHPVQAGRWSPFAVRQWLERAGDNPQGVAPGAGPRRRQRRAGYVDP